MLRTSEIEISMFYETSLSVEIAHVDYLNMTLLINSKIITLNQGNLGRRNAQRYFIVHHHNAWQKPFQSIRKVIAPILNIYISWASPQAPNSFNETSISGISEN